MGTKFRNFTIAALLAGSAAVLVAPPAEANRGNGTTTTTQGYVPTYGGNPEVVEEPDPYANANPVAPTVVPTELPAVTDPNAGGAGEGDRLGPAPSDQSTVQNESDTRPEAAPADDGGVIGGILSRTGAETLPLARAGLGALARGIGLVILARRRGAEAGASA
jgi:hypothetical protein